MCNRDGSMKMMSFKAGENNPAFFFLMVIWKHVMAIDGKSTSFFSSHSDVIWVQFLRLADICPPCKNSFQLRIQLNRKYSKKNVVYSCEIPCLIAFLQPHRYDQNTSQPTVYQSTARTSVTWQSPMDSVELFVGICKNVTNLSPKQWGNYRKDVLRST